MVTTNPVIQLASHIWECICPDSWGDIIGYFSQVEIIDRIVQCLYKTSRFWKKSKFLIQVNSFLLIYHRSDWIPFFRSMILMLLLLGWLGCLLTLCAVCWGVSGWVLDPLLSMWQWLRWYSDRNASEYHLNHWEMEREGFKTHPETPQRLTNSTQG